MLAVGGARSEYVLPYICSQCHNQAVAWKVDLHAEFVPEFEAFPDIVQDELLAHIAVLETFGPQLGRPRVDTLNSSRHKNMKELRFDADNGVWRVAFAFDPKRTAIVLCGGDKSGGSEQRFYRRLIAKADERFGAHMADLKARETKKKGKQQS